MAENLNSCHPHGKSRLVSRLPASAWPGFCRHLGGQPVEEDTLAHPFELSALKKKNFLKLWDFSAYQYGIWRLLSLLLWL